MSKICKNCENEFPYKVEIGGKVRNLQNRKYCLDCSPFGEHNTKQLHKEDEIPELPEEKKCCQCKIIKSADRFYMRSSRVNQLGSICKTCDLENV